MTVAMGAASWIGVGQAGLADWVDPTGASYIYLPMHPGGLEKKEETQFSGQARGGDAIHGRSGNIAVDGPLPMDWYPRGQGAILRNVFPISQSTLATGIYQADFTIPTNLHLQHANGLPVLIGLDTTVMRTLGAQVTALQWQIQSNFLLFTPTVIAPFREFISASPTFGSSVPMVVAGHLTADLTIDGTTYSDISFKQLNINIPVPTALDYSDNDTTARDVNRSEKIVPEVSWGWKFSDSAMESDLMDAWDNKLPVQLVVTLTGADLGSGHLETLRFTFPYLHRGGQDPKVAGAGFIPSQHTWKAARDHVNGASAVTIRTISNISYS